MGAKWTVVDAHECTTCGFLDRSRDGIMAHLQECSSGEPPVPWVSFPGRVPVCQDCGADWRPVRRGECLKCGSDAGPLRPASAADRFSDVRDRAAVLTAEDVAALSAIEPIGHCVDTCAPHLYQFCSPECEARAANPN